MSLDVQEILDRCAEYHQLVSGDTERCRRLDAARLNRDYYQGTQWEETEYNAYKDKGINCITVNRILPAINNVSGQQQANRQDIKVRPRRGGKEVVANIYTALIAHTMDQSNAEYVIPMCFHDGLYKVESYLYAEMDSQTAGGQILISNRSLFNTAVDPEATEYDVNKSAKYVVMWDWIDKDEIGIRYPDAEIHKGIVQNRSIEQVANSILRQAGYDVSIDDENYQSGETETRKKIFRFMWWESVKGLRVFDPRSQAVVTLTDSKQIASIKKQVKDGLKYQIKDVPARKLHITTVCDGMMLADEVDVFGDRTNMLPLSRFSPYWNDGKPFGIADNIRSLNYEENVFRTEATRILKQTANSGWLAEKIMSDKDRNYLELYGSVNGIVLDKSRYGGSLEKIAPNQMPAGHMEMAKQFSQDAKEVPGVNDALLGYDTGRNESGRAIDLKQRQGMTTQQPLFNNFDATLRIFGNFILRAIQNTGVYSESEIREIIGQSNLISDENKMEAEAELKEKIGGGLPEPTDPRMLMPNPTQMAVLKPEDMSRAMQSARSGIQSAGMYLEKYPQLLSKWTDIVERVAEDKMIRDLKESRVSDYWIKVTLSPSSQTTRMATLSEMAEVSDRYPGVIPPDVFVEATDLPNKEQIIKRLQQPQVPAAAGVRM